MVTLRSTLATALLTAMTMIFLPAAAYADDVRIIGDNGPLGNQGNEKPGPAVDEPVPLADPLDDWIEQMRNDQRTAEGDDPSFIIKGGGAVGYIPEDVGRFGGPSTPEVECKPPLFEVCTRLDPNMPRIEEQGTVHGTAIYGYDIEGNLVQADLVFGYWGSGQTWIAQAEGWVNGLGESCGCARTTHGCFAAGVKIKMADGTEKEVQEMAAGDQVLNPITGRAARVRQIIEGPEALPLLEVAFAGSSITVSQLHPVPVLRTDRTEIVSKISLTDSAPGDGQSFVKLKQASELAVGDRVIGKDGKPHQVTALKKLPVVFGQHVYNLELDTDSQLIQDHMLLSNGMVTGDYQAQLRLSGANSKK